MRSSLFLAVLPRNIRRYQIYVGFFVVVVVAVANLCFRIFFVVVSLVFDCYFDEYAV